MELKLSVELINKILEALGERVYKDIYPLVNEIHSVCTPQLLEQQRIAAEAEATSEAETAPEVAPEPVIEVPSAQ